MKEIHFLKVQLQQSFVLMMLYSLTVIFYDGFLFFH